MRQLSPAAARSLLHTRRVQCTAWEREDGLWDVEGRLSDVRTHDLDDSRGNATRRAGEPIHLMSLRLTLDDGFLVVGAEAVSHQTPYADCPRINDSYGHLVGLRIEAGFLQAVKTRFRGVQGCTHLTELLGPIATTALQSMRPAMEQRRSALGLPRVIEGPRPALMDSCFALRRDGPAAAVRWALEFERDAPPA
jgi:hypothetical protein